jgi:cytoskeletal protein CcmA (bactofilin family)
MSLFKKKHSIGLLEPTLESFETIIGGQTEIHGRIVMSKGLRIDGTVIGNVEGQAGEKLTVALGKDGLVQGDIKAYRILIAGRVEGNVYASERVELHDSADVHGDITYSTIGIEHGAKLNGLLISKGDDASTLVIDPNLLMKESLDRISY